MTQKRREVLRAGNIKFLTHIQAVELHGIGADGQNMGYFFGGEIDFEESADFYFHRCQRRAEIIETLQKFWIGIVELLFKWLPRFFVRDAAVNFFGNVVQHGGCAVNHLLQAVF